MKKRIYIAAAAILILLLSIIVIIFGVDWKKTVGICYTENIDDSNASYRQSLVQALQQYGMDVIVATADNDHDQQLAMIEQLTAQHCDALIVEPVSLDDNAALIDALNQTGLPAVLINSPIDYEMVEANPYITYVGADDSQPGALQAQMVTLLPDGGDKNGDGVVSYMVIQGPEENRLATLYTASFRHALESYSKEAEMLTICYGDWSAASGEQLCTQEMAAFGKDIEVIVCGSDQMAIGAAKAIENGGWSAGQDVYIFGIGAEQDALHMIRDGKIAGTVSADIDLQISGIVDAIIHQLGGQKVSNSSGIQQLTVTAENVDQFLK